MSGTGGGKLVPFARITKTQGLRGEFRALPSSGESENLGSLERLFIRTHEGPLHAYSVQSSRRQKSFYILKLEGVDSVEAAREILGAEILAEPASLTPLPEGEYYWYELVGLRVLTHDGRALGTVTGLLATGANDVLVVADGDRERLIPYTDDAVASVDLANALITLSDQEGLEEL